MIEKYLLGLITFDELYKFFCDWLYQEVKNGLNK